MGENRAIPKFQVPFYWFYSFALFLLVCAFLLDPAAKVFEGFVDIQFATDNLITDYFYTDGLGAAFFNSAVSLLYATFIIQKSNTSITGPLFAVLFMVAGFSFFGKNLFNSLPITLGAYLYSRKQKESFSTVLLPAFFGTSLGPVVSQIAFGWTIPFQLALPLAFLAGLILGYLMTPLANYFISFHQGYNLYNMGFTTGIMAMILASLFRMFNLQIEVVRQLYEGPDTHLYLGFAIFCLVLIGIGIKYLQYKEDLWDLFRSTGKLISDFVADFGVGATLINVGLSGLLSLGYLKLLGAPLNGPALGAILGVMGFSAFGKHWRNILPVFFGVTLAMAGNIYHAASTEGVLTLLFATTLAPVAGHYGPLAGIAAGFLHTSLAFNIGSLSGGLNLYNNGFSGGFIAAFLVALLESPIFSKFRRES